MLDALFNKQMMSEGMAFVSFELKRFCSFVIRIIADWQITNDRVNWIDKQRWLIDISDDPDLNDSLRFLREREIVHSMRFREAVEILKEERDKKKIF